MFKDILNNVKNNTPMVHAITNLVTINDCANIILAAGGSAIMANDIDEVKEISKVSSSLVINIGTLNKSTINSMIEAGKICNILNKPVILDPVGAGGVSLRSETALKLINEINFSVIRGNASEIKFLATGVEKSQGIDVSATDKITENNIENIIAVGKTLSKNTNAVIVITGETDIIINNEKVCLIKNGHEMMSKITGSGCMLSVLIGCYCGGNSDKIFESVITATCALGIAGELAHKNVLKTNAGTGSFKIFLIDFISNMTSKILEENCKYEIR